MFRGEYLHTIDPKGRLSVPAKFREELLTRNIDTLVLTEGDRCIWAFPMDEWLAFEERLRERSQVAPEMRHFIRLTVAKAKDCPIDRAGRMLVPPELRDFAGLKKDVMVVGALAKLEIWSRDRWVEHHQDLRGSFDDMTRKLSEFGL